MKVLDVRIFNSYKGTGIAVLTCTFRIFITNSIDDVRLKRLAEVPGWYPYLIRATNQLNLRL